MMRKRARSPFKQVLDFKRALGKTGAQNAAHANDHYIPICSNQGPPNSVKRPEPPGGLVNPLFDPFPPLGRGEDRDSQAEAFRSRTDMTTGALR